MNCVSCVNPQGFRGSARYWRLLVVDAYSVTGKVKLHGVEPLFEAQGTKFTTDTFVKYT